MAMKKAWLFIGLIIIASASILRLFNFKNRWICVDGQWRAQGHPGISKPQSDCRDEFSFEREVSALSLIVNDAFFNKQELSKGADPSSAQKDIVNPISSESSSTPIKTLAKELELISPQAGEIIRSPYVISGRAKGNWFFEGLMPFILLDANRQEIASGSVVAQGDAMTDDMVDFKAELVFTVPEITGGELIIKKDNPSGLPEYEAQVSYPVRLVP